MSSYLLDTDVLVDFLRGHAPAVAWFKQLQQQPMVSVITLAELRADMRVGEQPELERLFNALIKVPVDEQIARHAGDLRRKFGPSHGTGLADALIAASAISHKVRLVTLNVKHFPMLEDLAPPYLKV